MWRRVARGLALTLLLVSGGVGVRNGVTEWSGVTNGLQAIVTGGVLAYGVLGLASALAVMRRWRSAAWLVAAWGVDVTMVATLAPLAYGGPDVPLAGALAGGAATALIAVGIWWVTIRSARPAMPGPPVSR
jgi:hypothetical protein